MNKFSKFIAIVGVLALTICMMLVPCSAIGFGTASSGGGASIEYMPAYIENIHYYQYAFTNNSIQGESSARIDLNSTDSFDFNTSSDGSYSAVSLYNVLGTPYEGFVSIFTNEFVFKRGDLFANLSYPVFYVRTGGYGIPLGNARCVFYTTVNSRDTVSSFTDEVYVAFRDDIINGGSYITLDTEIHDVIASHSSLQSDVIEMRIEVYYDSTYDLSDEQGLICDCTLDYGDTVFVDTYTNIIENIDVLSWLPNTIDSFFNVSVIGDVTIGNIFLMVLAVPALIAVFRMLGGVG